MKVEDSVMPEPTVEEILHAHTRFESTKETVVLDAFKAAVQAMAMGFFPNNRIGVDNETPNDFDGIVLKVTIL